MFVHSLKCYGEKKCTNIQAILLHRENGQCVLSFHGHFALQVSATKLGTQDVATDSSSYLKAEAFQGTFNL